MDSFRVLPAGKCKRTSDAAIDREPRSLMKILCLGRERCGALWLVRDKERTFSLVAIEASGSFG